MTGDHRLYLTNLVSIFAFLLPFSRFFYSLLLAFTLQGRTALPAASLVADLWSAHAKFAGRLDIIWGDQMIHGTVQHEQSQTDMTSPIHSSAELRRL